MKIRRMTGFMCAVLLLVLLCGACREKPDEVSSQTTTSSGETTTTTTNETTTTTTTTTETTTTVTTTPPKTTTTTTTVTTSGGTTTSKSLTPTGERLLTTDPASTSQKSAPKSLKLSEAWDDVDRIIITTPSPLDKRVTLEKDDPRFEKLKTMLRTWQGTYKMNYDGSESYKEACVYLYAGHDIIDGIVVSKDFDWFASYHQQTGGKRDAYTLDAAKQKEFQDFFYKELGLVVVGQIYEGVKQTIPAGPIRTFGPLD